MNRLTDLSAWRDVLLQGMTELAASIGELLPRLIIAAVWISVGWIVARGVEIAARRTLGALGLDVAARRLRVTEVMEQAGLARPPSRVASRLLFWLTFLAFLLSGIDLLGFTAVADSLAQLANFVPELASAALILLIGLLAARFLATLAASAAAATGFQNARRIGILVQTSVVPFVAVIAMEQVGVPTSIVVLPLTVLVGAAALTAGVTFALGASPIVTHILAGHFLKQSLPRDTFVEVAGERGVVERIGATDTILRNAEKSWSVPNSRLLDEIVVR